MQAMPAELEGALPVQPCTVCKRLACKKGPKTTRTPYLGGLSLSLTPARAVVCCPPAARIQDALLPIAGPEVGLSHRRLQQGSIIDDIIDDAIDVDPDTVDDLTATVQVALEDFEDQAGACAKAVGLTTAFAAGGATAAYLATRKNRVGVAWKNKVREVLQRRPSGCGV